jgi:subtilisin family serine protease
VAVIIGVPVSGAVIMGPPAAAASEGGGTTARGAPLHAVTLVTGDTVRVYQRGGRQAPVVEPGKGRRGVRFAVTRTDGHLYVVPGDAVPLIGRGTLDRRLFDITGLIAAGYHDKAVSDLPLLVQGDSAGQVAPLVDDAGGTVTRRLSGVDAVALRQPKRRAGTFWSMLTRGASVRSGVKKVWLDGIRKPLLDESVPQVGAPRAWQAGYTGRSVKVAVLDTGIDATHPDLESRIYAKRNFTSASSTNDTVGHGTHVASTLAGTGAASGGRYKGVAPGARLLIGKVCRTSSCPESAILAGMQWAAESGAKVVNLSLGGMDTPEIDPLEQAVNALTARYGTLFVIAAGNSGSFVGDESVGSPASADAALAVGAVDKSDRLAYFSSRGPRVGDSALKPEITAPGVSIRAARAKDGEFGEPGERYVTASGTSMATPHVAGAAAILAQQHPGWDTDELKAALVGSAKTDPTLSAYAQGAGRLDVARAIRQGYATPATVSIGRAYWPHRDDEPVTRAVTYHNPGSQSVTYQLALRTMGPDGEPAPARMFTVPATSVTVPAGGTATVQVTVDTSVPAPDGYHSAWLVATAGTVKLTTPIAVNREPESYNLTFTLTDRHGAPAENYFLYVASLDRPEGWYRFGPESTFTMRLRAGRYHVLAFVDDAAAHHISLMTRAVYDLTRDGTLELDARTAKPNVVSLPHSAAKSFGVDVGYSYLSARARVGATVIVDKLSQVSTAHLGPEVPPSQMYSNISGLWVVPDSGGGFYRSPATYELAFYEYGHLLSGFSKQVTLDDVATVRTEYRSHGTGKEQFSVWFPWPTRFDAFGSAGFGITSALPLTRTRYVSGDGVRWNGFMVIGGEVFEGEFQSSDNVTYENGRAYRETWNNAVSGPGFSDFEDDGVFRDGNRMTAVIPLRTDGAGHFGVSYTDTGLMKLYRNGVKVGERSRPWIGSFTVPARTADYRLTVDATRA